MVIDVVGQAWNRYRPQEGWLSPILLLTVVVISISTVLEVGWVPEDTVIVPTALLGLLMGYVLAKRPLAPWIAWTFVIIYGLLVTTVTVANLWPPVDLLFSDWPALRLYWLDNGALFLDRAGGWFTAVFNGSQSNETIIFAYLMGLGAWLLAAYAGWSAFRLRRPLLGLTLLGLMVAINGYYGEASIEIIILFTGIALLATAVLHFSIMEWSWQQKEVDYSREIRLEMLAYATGIGVALLALAFLLPSFNPSKLARTILSQPAFASIEETYDRIFAGVEPPRDRPIAPGKTGGAGIMPRSFLLGNPPELEKNIMLTAETELIDGPESATLNLARHWRGLSYEVYTGRGWSLAEERLENFEAEEAIRLPPMEESILIEQAVNWRFDNRVIRYTLGFPESFDQAVTTYWRSQNDFIRAASEDIPRYNVVSRAAAATPEQLRQVTIDDIHPFWIYRYTNLPANIPERIHDLAQEATLGAATPYDQALALERFLRQYPYSLDVSLPPEDVDPVDYFLFDLQEGYCDYFASSMVVMARSLGLPARVATGFLTQPTDEDGVQTVRQINAHSWAEVYFGGYGWVEFEPTAAFVSQHDLHYADSGFQGEQFVDEVGDVEPVPIPDRVPQGELPWRTLVMVLLGTGLLAALVWRFVNRPRQDDEVLWAFNRLQQSARRLGHPLPPSQTPDEFSAELLGNLKGMGDRPRIIGLVNAVWSPIRQLTGLFVLRQYGGKPIQEPETAVSLWHRIRRPMWILWLNKRFRRGSRS